MIALFRRPLARLLHLLPPLSQLRDQNARLSRRVARLRIGLARTESQRAAARTRDRAARDRVRQRLDQVEADLRTRATALRSLEAVHLHPGDALQPAMAHRARLVRGAGSLPAAEARDRDWRRLCPAYEAEMRRRREGDPPTGSRTVEIGGLTWHMPPDAASHGSLSQRIVDRGWLPLDDVARVRRLVVGGRMLDIGANIGTTAIPRALLRDFDVIYAAEPDPDNYACLVANIAANGLTGTVLPDPIALSSAPGTLRLRRSTHIGTHHLLPADEKPHLPSIEVPGYTLDGWVARLGVSPADLSFIKVDAQGWDAHVLQGARGLLAARHLVWQVEFSPTMMDRTGAGVRAFVDLVTAHFTHLRLMGEDEAERPVASVAEIGAALAATGGYTNLLLYSYP